MPVLDFLQYSKICVEAIKFNVWRKSRHGFISEASIKEYCTYPFLLRLRVRKNVIHSPHLSKNRSKGNRISSSR